MNRLTKAQMEFMNGYVPATIHDIYDYQQGGVAQGDQGNDKMMKMIQTYAQMVAQESGEDPNKVYQDVMQQLQQLKPDQQEEALKIIVKQVQTVSQQPAMQMGGDPSQMQEAPQQQGGDAEQLIQQVQQMLQQGAQPQEVIAQLLQLQIDPQMIVEIFVQLGMPQEQVVPAVQEVMQQMGGGQEQEVPQEQSMEEPMQESMAYGGVAKYPYGGMYADKKYYGDFLPQDAFNNAMTDINMLAVPAATMAASGVKAFKPVAGIMSAAGALAGSIQGYRGLFNKDAASTPKNPITKAQATNIYNTYGKPNTDPWASKMMDKYMNPNKDPWATEMQKKYMQDGGTPNNPGFNALPKYVQDKILDNMQTGGPYKIKDEREGMMQTRDNMSDINVFSQNQMSLKKPVVQKEIKKLQKQAKNSKVVVFAETPTEPIYNMYDDEIEKIPELYKLAKDYRNISMQRDSIYADPNYEKLNSQEEKLFNKYLEAQKKYGDEHPESLKYNNQWSKLFTQLQKAHDVRKKKIDAYNNKLRILEEDFNKNPLNPVKTDSTFYTEAKNVQDFYRKTNPNTKVDIVPLYGDDKLMQKKLRGMSEFDKFAIFGHSGDRLAGIPNDDIAKYLNKSQVKDCYFGSCGFENQIENSNLKKLKNKTLHYRPSGNMWWGFNPAAKTFDEGMWSRQDKYDAYIPVENVPQSTGISVLPIKEGVSHINSKLKYGGLPQAQFGIPPGFDFNNPFGMQTPRFGQTANIADTRSYPQNYQNPYIDYNKLNNFSIGPGINDNASLSYGDPYGADGVNREVPKQTTMTPASAYGTGVTPYSKTNMPKTNNKTIRNVSGRQMANNSLLNLSIANYALGESGPRPKSVRQTNQQREANMLSNPLNYLGVNTTNVQGGGNQYLPNRYDDVDDYGTTGNVIAKTGGQMNFAAGGQYKVSHDQLLQLLRDGAEIEFL